MISFFLYGLLFLYAFWAVYVLVMGIYRAHLAKRLKGAARVMAVPLVIVGYAMDILANITVACVIFFDVPREWLVTSRLKRYIESGQGWRARLAVAVCDGLLDMFDPNENHC